MAARRIVLDMFAFLIRRLSYAQITRFDAAPTSADGELEDVQLAVRGAPISRDADWLPAIEQFGEGIFIHFDEAAIARWLQREATQRRNEKLLAGYGHWQIRF